MSEILDFWETVPLRWVKWSKEAPNWNGAVYVKFNGKNEGVGIVHNGELIKLDGLNSSQFDKYFDTFYWLKQEINAVHDIDEVLEPSYLHNRVFLQLEEQLKKQEANGKQFITDEEIDNLINEVLKEELGDNYEK